MIATVIQPTSPRVVGVTARVHQFARLLRDNGFCIGLDDVRDAMRTLVHAPDHKADTVRRSLKLLFCSRRAELERFDEIFDAYWLDRVGRKATVHRIGAFGNKRSLNGHDETQTGPARGLLAYFEWADPKIEQHGETDNAHEDERALSKLGGASGRSIASTIDAEKISDPDEFGMLLEFADRLGARLRYRISRRRKARSKARSIHFRRTMRASISSGGLPIRLIGKIKREPPVSVVLFVDVSGSMDAYSLFFTRFVHAMTSQWLRAESFIFHTRLVHISRALRDANPTKMMEKMALIGQGWSGGTRIGASLAEFNANYAREFTSSRTVAIIMSDGYDTGPHELLGAELRTLKERCHKIIWLNPLLGRESYEPVTRAMADARKHIDVFAPAHNLRSLMLLEDLIVRA